MPGRLSSPAPQWRTTEPKSVHWELHLTTITPMFGGGAVAREIDEPPIRAASIRGQLRFWWRATAGAGHTDAKLLYDAESKLWGNTDALGKLSVRVEVTKNGQEAKLRQYLPEKPSPRFGPEAGYFVFPFNSDSKNPIANGRKEVEFDLTLAVTADAAQHEEIRRAIRAWITFGGIGARTRRGCGAIGCHEIAWLPKSLDDAAYFRDLMPADQAHAHTFPSLGGGWALLGEPSSGEACWRQLGMFWSRVRKGHFTPKRPDYSPMSGCQWRDHATLKTSHGGTIALAKPNFGMPIIYQKFGASFAGEITPGDSGRMASPIILKPVAFADGSIRPMVACLSVQPPTKVQFGGSERKLIVPVGDPVLNALDVASPLDAVRTAARRSPFNFREVPL
jgi:CRISPR-associated protein Cmr1